MTILIDRIIMSKSELIEARNRCLIEDSKEHGPRFRCDGHLMKIEFYPMYGAISKK